MALLPPFQNLFQLSSTHRVQLALSRFTPSRRAHAFDLCSSRGRRKGTAAALDRRRHFARSESMERDDGGFVGRGPTKCAGRSLRHHMQRFLSYESSRVATAPGSQFIEQQRWSTNVDRESDVAWGFLWRPCTHRDMHDTSSYCVFCVFFLFVFALGPRGIFARRPPPCVGIFVY